jgi:protein-disulfide isomerase
VKTLYKNIDSWGYAPDPDALLIQYAKLGGLSETAAKACLNDTGLQDQIVAKRNDAAQKYNINATPTFLINGGMEKIEGAKTVEEFSAVFDRFLAMSH